MAKSYVDGRHPHDPRTPASFPSSLESNLRPVSAQLETQKQPFTERRPSPLPLHRVRPVDLENPATLSRHTWRQRREERLARGRVHEHFEGNTVFCLGGRFQNSRQKPINIATACFMVAPCVLFGVFEAAWQWKNVSPATPVVFAYLFYLCLSSFIHASASDPGILPRNLHPFPPEEDDDPLRVGPPTNDWTLVKSSENATAAMEVPVKFCETCRIWRPPRAHHCRLCDNCIEGHDHHCVWLNNCVGRRNYRYFFAFVLSASLLGLYLFALTLAHLLIHASRQHVSFGSAIGSYRVTFALMVIGLVAFTYPAALMCYHVFLMARGETTREFINSQKFVPEERYRAFTQGGWFRNWIAVLCRPRTPTYYRFKERYRLGDQRLSEAKRSPWRQSFGRGETGEKSMFAQQQQQQGQHQQYQQQAQGQDQQQQPALEMGVVKPLSAGTTNPPTTAG